MRQAGLWVAVTILLMAADIGVHYEVVEIWAEQAATRAFATGVVEGPAHFQEIPVGTSTATKNLGDPSRPPGKDSDRAVIVIPLDKSRAVELTDAEDGVYFDIDGDGRQDRIAWTVAGTDVALLALDRDSDGAVTNGQELIGGVTLPGAWNGFMALRMLEPAAGGSITAEHSLFSRLLLWTDRNHNGTSEAGEMRKIGELFQKIGLGYFDIEKRRTNVRGNPFRFEGWLLPTGVPMDSADGYRPAYDVVLQVKH